MPNSVIMRRSVTAPFGKFEEGAVVTGYSTSQLNLLIESGAALPIEAAEGGELVRATRGPGGGIGNLRYDDYASFAGIENRTTPRDGPLLVPRSALTRGVQTLWRRSPTLLDVVSRAGADLWLRTLIYNYFTSSSSAGVASEFWRWNRLVKLDGAVAVPTATPSSVGSYTTADRVVHPHTDNGGQTVASGVIYGSTANNAAISWAVTVPASGIMRAILFNSPSTAQAFEVTCGGVTVSGMLASSPTNGVLPKVVTLYGCTPGASTLTITKKNSGSSLYTAGLCYDLSAGDIAPANASLIYWFGTNARYVDHPGANELAIKIGSTFWGSYHGGHYGTDTFALDGVPVNVLSGGPCYTARESIAVRHQGRIGSIGINATTTLFADGHVFDASLRADDLSVAATHLVMICGRPDMSFINGVGIPADSTYRDADRSRPYLDQYSEGRAKAVSGWMDRVTINGSDGAAALILQSVNTGPSGYVKGYLSTGAITLGAMDWSAVWTY